jgi:hypothetical protein
MSWGIRLLGRDLASFGEIGPTHKALAVQSRPLDYGIGGAAKGQYKISVVTGTLAAALAAAAQVFQFKWIAAGSDLAVIHKLKTRFLPLTPFTAATLTDHTSFDAFVCRPFGAGGGGTTLTLTGNNAKMRTNMATSQAQINVSTTAALTAATGMDTQPFDQSIRKGNRVNPAAATEEVIMPTIDGMQFEPDMMDGDHPLVLAPGEGLVIRNRTVWPAAGTGILLIELRWSEVASF